MKRRPTTTLWQHIANLRETVNYLVPELVHALVFSCWECQVSDVGTFVIHSQRLTRRCYITFQPAPEGETVYVVPYVRDRNGLSASERMLTTTSTGEAMSVLHAAIERRGFA